IATPVSGCADDQIFHMPAKVSSKVAFAARPLFSKVNVLVGMGVVDRAERADVAEIQVKCRTVNHSAGNRIVEDSDRVFRVVAVMVKDYNLSFDASVLKGRTQVIPDKHVLFGTRHGHARRVSGMFRFVLYGDGIDGYA